MARWVVEVLSLPDRLKVGEEPFDDREQARDFVAELMGEAECVCAIRDTTGAVPVQRFERTSMVGRYDDWD